MFIDFNFYCDNNNISNNLQFHSNNFSYIQKAQNNFNNLQMKVLLPSNNNFTLSQQKNYLK